MNGSKTGHHHDLAAAAAGSPEPVYRFYLSPPPPAPMQPGGPAAYTQQQAMYQPPLGLVPYNAYMPLSPPSMGNNAGVSAFAQPTYYAPQQQPQQQQAMYYPQPAYAMPALGGVQPRVSTMSTLSSTSSSNGAAADAGRGGQTAAAAAEAVENAQTVRAKTTIVNENGVPMGGFGADQDGQYIEIKFPTFGQVQMQQMLQQLHIQQQAQLAQQAQQQQMAMASSSCSPPCGIHHQHQQHQSVTAVPSMQTVVAATVVADNSPPPVAEKRREEQQQPTPISTTPEAPAATPALLPLEKTTGGVSIYEAEAFAERHMEDIVFDSKAFFWKIGNWDKLERRATSDVFRCGGHIWRILLRPFGSSHKGVLSLFLECLGTSDTSDDWRCTCRFVLAIANPHEPEHNTHGSAYHCFHRSNPNWGFTRFMKLADLRTASAPGVRPYIEDGACTISAYLHVIKEPSQ
ncbi:ubiquitin-specific protease ubp15 [Coemansia aciculifera]|uniref:Ubiquitin-specific protease ubp15 n=1 Tax=Coemansia aciculifera TaxID=417176 RepID=A0ACC1LYG8_9FUNG|nr:ubiquitin-specific protease ubp15 [Coemansia aciculifera]